MREFPRFHQAVIKGLSRFGIGRAVRLEKLTPLVGQRDDRGALTASIKWRNDSD